MADQENAAPKLTVKGAPEAAPATSAPQSTSSRFTRNPDGTVSVVSKDGHRITVRKLNAMLKMDFSQILGADAVQNPGVVGPASMAFSVTEIDGEKIFPPANYNELRALVGRLDDDGIEAASAVVIEFWGGEPVDPTEAKADLKNS